MAKGQTVILSGPRQVQLGHRLIDAAPSGAVLTIAEAARTNDQNALMWALLSDVARAKPEGRSMPTETWKCLFMQAAGFSCRFEPGLDGEGVVPIGFKSSRLKKAEFSELIEAIYEYGARHGVIWSDEARQTAA